MRIENWKYGDKEYQLPILDDDEIEKNEDIDEFDKTEDITHIIETIGDNDVQ